MIRRWPIAGEMTAECATASLPDGLHLRCKSTREHCACDCHAKLAQLATQMRLTEELGLRLEALVQRVLQ